MVSIRHIPRKEVPKGVYSQLTDVVGKVALVTVPRNSPVAVNDIEQRGVNLGLSYVIPSFMRAVTVKVDPVIGVAGFLKPRDHVDVLATFRAGDQAVAKIVLQDVELLALGSQVEKDQMERGEGKPQSDGRETATLLVTPDDAQKLVLAENEGKLRLVLRSYGDVARVDAKSVSTSNVTGDAVIAKRQAAAERYRNSAPPAAQPAAAPRVIYTPAPQAATSVRVSPRPQPTARSEKKPGDEIEVIRGTEIKKVELNEGGSNN
jgi:pilus assembly protein CpaB